MNFDIMGKRFHNVHLFAMNRIDTKTLSTEFCNTLKKTYRLDIDYICCVMQMIEIEISKFKLKNAIGGCNLIHTYANALYCNQLPD